MLVLDYWNMKRAPRHEKPIIGDDDQEDQLQRALVSQVLERYQREQQQQGAVAPTQPLVDSASPGLHYSESESTISRSRGEEKESSFPAAKRFAAASTTDKDIPMAAAAATTTNTAPVPSSLRQAILVSAPYHEPALRIDGSQQERMSKMQSCLQRIPNDKKTEYMAALQQVPQLVQEESNPARFLEACFDPSIAAERLVTYWKNRCALFGRTRAFSSLRGVECLTHEEQLCLATGQFALLPKDQQGRVVLCEDPSRSLFSEPSNAASTSSASSSVASSHEQLLQDRLRCCFWIAQRMAENPVSQTQGIVGLSIINSKTESSTLRQDERHILICTAPIRVHAWHIIDLTSISPSSKADSKPSSVPPVSPSRAMTKSWDEEFAAMFPRETPTTVHRYSRTRDYTAALELFGISQVPTCMGGSWKYQQDTLITVPNKPKSSVDSIKQAPTLARVDEPTSSLASSAGSSDPVVPLASRPRSVFTQHFALLELVFQQLFLQGEKDIEYYRQALVRAPQEAWEVESNLDWFLLSEDLHVPQAARRIIDYWKFRHDLFGSERVYLPLNQTGDGALCQNDLAILRSVFCMILPSDKKGCPVLWIHASRLESAADSGCVRRCLFYMFSLALENSQAQRDGVSLIIMWEPDALHQPDRQRGAASDPAIPIDFLREMLDTMPMKVKALHLLNMSDQGIPNLESFKDLLSNEQDLHVHTSTDSYQLVLKLEKSGMVQANLPKVLGGEWGIEKFFHWKELRTRCEWNLPLGLSGRTLVSESSNYPAIRPYSLRHDVDKTERKRRLNVIHTRRKRDRVRVEVEVLKEHVMELRTKQAGLVHEYRRLDNLMQSAVSVVTRHHQQQSRMHRQHRRYY